MSVYSGFCTRQQESLYNKQLEVLIKLITTRLYNFYCGDIVDDITWIDQFVSATKALAKMEKEKYMAPRFSVLCRGLLDYFLNRIPSDSTLEHFTPPVRTPALQRSVDAYRALSSSTGKRKHSKRRKAHSTARSKTRWAGSTTIYRMSDGTDVRYSFESGKNSMFY